MLNVYPQIKINLTVSKTLPKNIGSNEKFKEYEYSAKFDLLDNSDIFDWNVMQLHQHFVSHMVADKLQSNNGDLVKTIGYREKFDPYRDQEPDISHETQIAQSNIGLKN